MITFCHVCSEDMDLILLVPIHGKPLALVFGLDMHGMSWPCMAVRADLCTSLQFGLNMCILSLALVLATE